MTEIRGQNYPGKRYRYDGRNIPDPRGPRTFTRHLTRPVSSMPSVLVGGSPTGPRSMHPALKNPARFSRKASIADVGSGGEGKIEVYRPTKPSLIAGVMEKLPALFDFGIQRARTMRQGLRGVLWGDR